MEFFSQQPHLLIILLVGSIGLGLGLGIFYLARFIKEKRRKLLEAPLPEFLPESQFQQVNQFKIHYQQTGKGKDLLLIHGIGASTYTWRFLFQPLSKKFKITALDLPGFGQSSKLPEEEYGLDHQAQRVLNFLDLVDIKTCYVMGSSMGGALALYLGLNHPDRFHRIVTLSPAIHKNLIPLNAELFLKKLRFTFKLVNKTFIKLALNRLVTDPSLVNNESIEAYFAPYNNNTQAIECFLKATYLIKDPSMPQCFKSLSPATLTLYGQKDKLVPQKYIHQLQELLPNSSLARHPNAGHHPMEDNPKWVLSQTLPFLT